MSDGERTALMKQMDEELEEHFRKLEQKAKEREGQKLEGDILCTFWAF